MTYPIANVIFGFPYSREIQAVYLERDGVTEKDFDDSVLEKDGFSFLYSAAPLDFEPIGFFGEELFSDGYWELKLQEFKPTPEQAERVWQAYMKLPEAVQKVAGEPRVCLVWSDS